MTPKKPPLSVPGGGIPPKSASLPAPATPGLPPLLAACDLLPLGDGSYRAVPRHPGGKVTVQEAARLAGYPRASIYRLYHGGFVTGERQSPRRLLIDVESLANHLQAVRNDAEFWNAERRERYWNGLAE